MAVVNSDDDSDDECVSARSDTEAKEDQGGETSCEDLGEDYEPPEGVKCMCEAPATSENIIGKKVAYRYDCGWFVGEVKRQVTCSDKAEENGKYAILFDGEKQEVFHALDPKYYGRDGDWVVFVAQLLLLL